MQPHGNATAKALTAAIAHDAELIVPKYPILCHRNHRMAHDISGTRNKTLSGNTEAFRLTTLRTTLTVRKPTRADAWRFPCEMCTLYST